MTDFVIGDIHGCFEEFLELIHTIRFNPDSDHLFFTGDIVNRGMDSCGILDWLLAHKSCSTVVLGNHDIHVLAYANQVPLAPISESFDVILAHPNASKWLHMMQQWPLWVQLPNHIQMVHAAINSTWKPKMLQRLVGDISQEMSSNIKQFLCGYYEFMKNYSGRLFWDNAWSSQEKWDNNQLFTALFILTKARYLKKADQGVHYHAKRSDHPSKRSVDDGWQPWYQLHPEKSDKIYFGHWALLAGQSEHLSCISIDGGCVHGGKLIIENISSGIRHDVSRFY
ncbi:MAG: symmetrical bis(5'-nucleosyl)-tetraphosphatase [Candidatus Comchoanobacterales bacterium]